MQDKKCSNRHKKGRPFKDELPNSAFGRKLKALQGDKNNSEMAKNLAIKVRALSPYIWEERRPDARQLGALRRETGVDLNWLCVDEDKRDGPILIAGPGVKESIEIQGVSITPTSESATIQALQGEVAALRETKALLAEKVSELKKEVDRLKGASDIKADRGRTA